MYDWQNLLPAGPRPWQLCSQLCFYSMTMSEQMWLGRATLLSHQVDLAVAARLCPGLGLAGRHNKEIGAKSWLQVQSSWHWHCAVWREPVWSQDRDTDILLKAFKGTWDTLMSVLYRARRHSSLGDFLVSDWRTWSTASLFSPLHIISCCYPTAYNHRVVSAEYHLEK